MNLILFCLMIVRMVQALRGSYQTILSPRGIEHPSVKPSKTPISEQRGTESGTVESENAKITSLVDTLLTLPETDRAAVLADLPKDKRLAVARLLVARIKDTLTT